MISRRSSGGGRDTLGGSVSKLGLDLTWWLACVRCPESDEELLLASEIISVSQHFMSIWFSSIGPPGPNSLVSMIPIY